MVGPTSDPGAAGGAADHGGSDEGAPDGGGPDEGIGRAAGVAETHSGIIVFLGDRAFKLKKPLDLGFVDYTTVEARRAACEQEVALNRRLSPDVYLGVGSLCFEGGDEPMVVMRRLPEDRRLAHLLEEGREVDGCLRRLAHQLAAFHSTASQTSVARRAASPEGTRARWEQNAEEMAGIVGDGSQGEGWHECLQEARSFLSGRGPLLERRIARGCAVDGHGDLLAQDIFCLDEGPAVLDCLEFDETLRSGDVLADVAFLAMDIERIGHPDRAWRLLELHRELLDDDWPTSLAHHHIAYRAQVRAKVAGIRAAQGGVTDEDPQALLGLARRHLRLGRVHLILVGGLPGSGKSTVAAAVGDRLGAIVLGSDETRKELAGIPALERATAAPGEGIYDATRTEQTYEAMLDQARLLLGMGESVVIDASFTDQKWRSRARQLATQASVRSVELRCVAPVAVLEERVTRRAEGPRTSDADVAVVRAMAAEVGPWPEATELPTTRPLDASVARAMHAVAGAPAP